MNKMMTWGAGVALMFAMGVAVADDTVTETRPVDARVARVHVEGVVNLTLKQGDTPSLTLTGPIPNPTPVSRRRSTRLRSRSSKPSPKPWPGPSPFTNPSRRPKPLLSPKSVTSLRRVPCRTN